MKITPITCTAFGITDVRGLDPVTVIFEDIKKGHGKVTIECFAKAWAAHWTAMPDQSVQNFFLSVDVDYLVDRLGPTRSDKAYLTRIVKVIRSSMVSTIQTQSYLAVLQHSLGVDQYGQGEMFRNYFVASSGGDNFATCQSLVSDGLMQPCTPSELTGGNSVFRVTDKGISFMRDNSPRPPNNPTPKIGDKITSFETHSDWVSRASTAYVSVGAAPHQVVYIDRNERILTTGRDFRIAAEDDAFPVHLHWARDDYKTRK